MADTNEMNRATPKKSTLPSEWILTVHGLLAGRRSMRSIGDAAISRGYPVIHWGYSSLRGSIQHHAAKLSRTIRELAETEAVEKIHFVTHSMGCIIARAAILDSRLESRFQDKCGRIVMLAPPNGGSRLTRLPLGPLASWFPQISELSEAPDSFVRQLPPLGQMRVGVIAAERDFVVPIDATNLDGQHDHVVLPTTHQRLTTHPDAIRMTLTFLKSLQFQVAPETLPFDLGTDQKPSASAEISVPQRRRVHSSAA